MTAYATKEQFKDRFDRDFPFGDGLESVRDKDIDRALVEASPFNRKLWTSDAEATTAYLFLTAHCLYMNLQAAGGLNGDKTGLNAQAQGNIVSSSVGSVSVTQSFPESILKSPKLSQLLLSPYGTKYLQMVAPRLVAGVATLGGYSEYDEFR